MANDQSNQTIDFPEVLGHYRIAEKIGEGGMGRVYRAHDQRLERDVAVKVLRAGTVSDEDARRHFRKEAHALSRLNHPNIETIFDFDSEQGVDFIITEYIEGQTLDQKLISGALPEKDILGFGLQLAEGLAAAHDDAVLHRDLKPANIRITPDRRVKILDFGLATLFLAPHLDGTTESLTDSLRCAGTLAYMAPEQIRGEKLDQRADIWSAGAVLYEMATGQPPFRATGLLVTDLILHHSCAAPGILNPLVSPALNGIILKCLDKDPENRYQSAKELVVDLRRLLHNSALVPTTLPARPGKSKLVWATVLLVLVGLLTAILLSGLRSKSGLSASSLHLGIVLPPDAPLAAAGRVSPAHDRPAIALSRDGSRLAYVAQFGERTEIVIRDMKTGRFTPLVGTEGGHTPFFSPAGDTLGFFAHGKLRTIPANGGPVVTLADAPNPWGAVWAEDGAIYFSRFEGEGIFKVAAAGGEVQQVTGTNGDYMPELLTHGQALLMTHLSDIAYVKGGDSPKAITSGLSPRYLADGYLFYVQPPGKLLATEFDPSSGTLRGTPVVLAENVRNANYAVAQFTVSQNGILTYATGSPQGLTEFVWVDRTGKTKLLGLPQDVYDAFALSPDGARLAYGVGGELWIYDLLRRSTSRLTPRAATGTAPICRSPRWTRDGKHVLYMCRRGDSRQLILASIDGTPETTLWSQKETGPSWLYPMGFSPDGSVLSAFGPSKDNSFDLYVLHLNEKGGTPAQSEPELFLGNRFGECFGQISPDGHWMLFASDQSGEYEVYVTSYPKPGAIYQVSKNGGREPVWNPGAPEIDYLDGIQMYAVDVTLGSQIRIGNPRVLFDGPFPDVSGFGYDIAPDGKSFLMLQSKELLKPVTTLNVITNVADEVRRRAVKSK